MRVRTALLLLLTLSLTLGLGVHPCGAMEQKPAGVEAQAAPAMPSCHATAPADAGGRHGCCGSEKKSSEHPDHLCPHICHATSLPAMTMPSFLTAQAITALVIGQVESAAAAPARSIDHVPLP